MRSKKPNAPFMRDVERRAQLRQILDENRDQSAPTPIKRRSAFPIRSTVPAPGARNYRVMLLTAAGTDNEAIQVEAVSMADAKKHAAAAFLSTPNAIGVAVRGIAHAEDDAQ